MGQTLGVARALAELIDAVLPTTCICCGTLGPHICLECRAKFESKPFSVGRGPLAGFAVFELQEPIELLLRAIKDSNRTAALGEVAGPMGATILSCFSDQWLQTPSNLWPRLVALPSSKRSLRRRGYDLNRMLARRVARLTGLQLETGLSFIRQPDDQRGLGQGDRHANLSNSMVFHPHSASARFILIDDVVTTGSTLVEAARAIGEAGAEVLGFCVFAETRLLQDAKNEK